MEELASSSSAILTLVIVIYSIILHEIAHGYAAYIQGDHTAYRAGRLTPNPLSHIDMVGSVLVPLIAFLSASTIFGWAKPVPYNVHNIRSRYGEAFVASAGVLANITLAILTGIAYKTLLFTGAMTQGLSEALFTVIGINISLAFFNLIPIPPFDGMAIIQALFPRVHIRSEFIYNPFYMVGAIIVASMLYHIMAPSLFSFITSILI